jgi:glycosyltransferase involved in cell wall biosynthesis
MRLVVKNFSMTFVIFGAARDVRNLYDQVDLLGVQPEYLLYLDGEDEPARYRGIPAYGLEHLVQFDSACPLTFVFKGLRCKFAESIEAIERKNVAIQGQRVMYYFEFLSELLKQADVLDPPQIIPPGKRYTLLALQLGFVLGGMETWVTQLCHLLKKAGAEAKLLSPLQFDHEFLNVGPEFYNVTREEVIEIGPFDSFLEYTCETLALLCKNPPAVFVDNGGYCLLAAAYLAKKRLGLPVKIIMVVHGDVEIAYKRVKVFHEIADTFIAVSDTIRDRLIQILPERVADIQVKINLPEARTASLGEKDREGPLQIAYAARLEASTKRALWLKEVITGLKLRQVLFMMHIAGDGECLEELKQFVVENGLGDCVKLYGPIAQKDMDEFWKDKHVFINFSTNEGGPLTLYEAMAHGLALVVTDTGCARKFVVEGYNGYMITQSDHVVDRLEYLSQNRGECMQMGQRALEALHEADAREENLETAFM